MLNNSQISQILEISLQAGDIAKEFFFNKNYIVSKKTDNSDVTSADIAVSDFISNNLRKLFPDIAIICEEKVVYELDKEIFFLIDPIDGTTGFLNGKDEFAVNIALIKNKKPIFGVIYAPVFGGGKLIYNNQDEVFLFKNLLEKLDYQKDHKSFLRVEEPVLLNKKKEMQNSDKIKIVTSRRASDDAIKSFIAQKFSSKTPKYDLLKLSSSVKFFYLAEEGYDYYIHLNQTMEWDIAAGHSIVEKLGYKVKKIELNDLGFIYNNELLYKKEFFVNSAFLISK